MNRAHAPRGTYAQFFFRCRLSFFFFGGGGGGGGGGGMFFFLGAGFLECGWFLWAKGRHHKFSSNLFSVTQFNMMPSFSTFSFSHAPQSQNQHMVLQ